MTLKVFLQRAILFTIGRQLDSPTPYARTPLRLAMQRCREQISESAEWDDDQILMRAGDVRALLDVLDETPLITTVKAIARRALGRHYQPRISNTAD